MKQRSILIKQLSSTLLTFANFKKTILFHTADDVNGRAVENKANFRFLIGLSTQLCRSDFEKLSIIYLCYKVATK